MINILLVEDQTLVREGLRGLLELSDNVRVVAEACNGEEVFALLNQHEIDIILLDIQMPKMNGIQVLKWLSTNNILIPVLVLTTFDDDERLLECAKLGAKGYLLKDVSFEQLITALETIYSGKTLIQPMVTQRILEGLENYDNEHTNVIDNPCLTDRELEVLRFMAGGYSNKEIANAMNLQEGTIKNHVSNILTKLGVRDRTRAVLKSISFGLLG